MTVPDLRSVLVYVAGPISKGCIYENVGRAHDAGLALAKAGLSVIVPHGTCFWGNRTAESGTLWVPQAHIDGTAYDDWISMSLELVRRCDAVLRLPGESSGADAEVAEAGRLRTPVFTDIKALVRWAEHITRE